MADDPAGCGAQTVRTPCWALHMRHRGAAVVDTWRTCQEMEAWGGPGFRTDPEVVPSVGSQDSGRAVRFWN